jgi:hypothetical protein
MTERNRDTIDGQQRHVGRRRGGRVPDAGVGRLQV